MSEKKRLGELLLEANLITKSDLDHALQVQVGGSRRLGYLLIKMGYITEEELHSVLSQQLDLPIVSIKDEFSAQVKKILPRYLCRKYSIMPLAIGDSNILTMAMVDPSDFEAVADIEKYTNKIVQPVLASKSDIDTGIESHIPWSLREIFNAGTSSKITGAIAGVALIMVVVVGLQFYQDSRQAKYGTITRTAQAISYENLELILGFTHDEKISLFGRGAHSSGYYSVVFNNPELLNSFIEIKKDDFSTSQLEWLSWAMSNPWKKKMY